MGRGGSLLGLVLAFGCGAADYMGAPLQGAGTGNTGSNGGVGSGGAGGGGSNCTNVQATPMDPSTLPDCSPACGGAHCVPSANVPANVAAQLATCTGGYCVPDAQIKAPTTPPPSCKSLSGAAGVCLSVCVPQVAQYKDLLPQDVCATDERCAPCVNPLNNMPSGACDIGKAQTTCDNGGGSADGGASTTSTPPAPPMCPYSGPPLLDVSTLPSCSDLGGAHCVATSLVPAAMASQLATCPTGLCAPDVFIQAAGNYIPKSCTSLDGAEGRCLHVAIPQVAKQAAMLTQDVCESYEKCVPCYSPIDGMPTGSCKLSCDPGPTKAAVLFANCCQQNNTTEGRCVPSEVIPSAEQKNLQQKECAQATDLCVPSEMLAPDFKPVACTASTLLTGSYTGVCLSDCLQFSFIQNLGISRGSCDNLHKCAPCTDPLSGKPTGAPGCP